MSPRHRAIDDYHWDAEHEDDARLTTADVVLIFACIAAIFAVVLGGILLATGGFERVAEWWNG